MENYKRKSLSLKCEHIIRSKFQSLAENRYSEVKMFNFSGLISSDLIKENGGLYLALSSTLARYYDELSKMEMIDKFLDEYYYIHDKSIDEIVNVEEILEKFNEITK